MQDLTKEARKTLKAIYDEYRKRRDDGMSKAQAVRFSATETTAFPGFSDVEGELSKAQYIRPNIFGDFDLTDRAIVFMENFTKDSIVQWLELGAKFIP